MTVDEQIKHLNETVKCTLRPSPIHGIGVFALRDIKKGEKLGCNQDTDTQVYDIPPERLIELRPEIRALILDRWPQIEGGRSFASPNQDALMMSFMNYSKTPNAQGDKAIKDIKAGEEITEDYDTGNLSDMQKKHYNFL